MSRAPLLAFAFASMTLPAAAQSVQWHGFVETRAIAFDGDDDRWLDGGHGKARTDARHDGLTAYGVLAAQWQATPELFVSAEAQYVPETRRPLDLIDASARWRPVSTTPWRTSLRAGMFFPPVSLENDAVGWTSPWTLTPSAINTWVGEELRTLGLEGRVEHRGERGTFGAGLALFVQNDPAGELLATRGWAMHDIVAGLDGSLRQPDDIAASVEGTAPVRFRPFIEMDHRPGVYATVDWRTPAQSRVVLTAYDNRADATREIDYAGRELYAWRTRFWSAAGEHRVGDVVLLAQLMCGSTLVEPMPGLQFDTRFAAGYLLAGWEHGAWRPALRVDLFQSKQTPGGGAFARDEHGRAFTAALNWRPNDRLRVTAEALHIDSTRPQRRAQGLAPRQRETQLQASVRWFF